MPDNTSPEKPAPRRRNLFLFFFVFYTVTMLLCLRQWHNPHPWSRLDRFSGGYILTSFLWLGASYRFFSAFLRRKEIAGELSGSDYDPWTLKLTMLLPLAELTVFLDYGHWHLLPGLVWPPLQWFGLALSVAGGLLLYWTDKNLLTHFIADMTRREVMETGPYRFIRHPRYLALIVSRVALALALASPLAWGFVVLWIIVLVRRMRLEEAHLRKIFGADYAAYSHRTSRLLPGIY